MVYPSTRLGRKLGIKLSGDNAELNLLVTVPDNKYAVVWKLWVSLDVASETDLENLPATANIKVSIGASVWHVSVHPLVEHTSGTPQNFRWVDLGPWAFDFGEDGFYSGVNGNNITVTVDAMGTGVKSRARIIYHGD